MILEKVFDDNCFFCVKLKIKGWNKEKSDVFLKEEGCKCMESSSWEN